ncbi:MAG TPA: tetratricopeptide repeat protein [Verrucomicrobiae bacterium]|jgi:tetratricopeptide (TPR) repeat protein
MKLFLAATLLFAGLLASARAQSEADEKYIGIYSLIQQADQFAVTGESGEALAAFTDAQKGLQQFQRVYPDWNPNIVNFRLNQLADKIAELTKRVPAPVAPTTTSAAPSASGLSSSETSPSSEAGSLRAQLQAALAANEALQAKIKEALAVQPAAVDPRELARAEEKIRSLMKQNDLLMANQDAANPARAEIPAVTNIVVVTNFTRIYVTNSIPVEVTNFADVFVKNAAPAVVTNLVVVTNFVRTVVVDTNALEMLRLDHAAAVKNFNDEHDRAEQLADELQRLRRQSNPEGANPPALAALLAENASLKGQLERLRAVPAAPAAPGSLAEELKQARAQIAALQAEAQIAALEKLALEQKVRQLLAATNSSVGAAALESRIRELVLERDDLIEKLDSVSRRKSGVKNAQLLTQLAALNSEVAVLRSRLAVAEAQPVPYSAEELALFKNTVPQPASPDAGKKSIKEMPAGTAELVATAQGHFARSEYDQAEADYQKILDRDQNNGIALANLATIELRENKLADAEKHIRAALAQSPDDAYNLATFGSVRFAQEQYDEALNYLSRAAQVDPNNPEIQNYLGLTLSHLGQRKAAESALRRAIQLAPDYAPAHNNLAVVYLSQTPPLAELARWHYQKAVAAGQPRNPDLEKMLADKGSPVRQ